MCGGGVGRNMAEALWRLRGGRVKLLTAIGDDADGHYISGIVPGLLLDGCTIKGARTSMYSGLFDSKGECLLGLGDMDIHNQISVELVNKHIETIEKAPLIVIDGNVPQNTMNHVLELCNDLQKPVFFEPTDRRKALKALLTKQYKVTYASPNISELRAMAKFLEPNITVDETSDVNEILNLSKIVTKFIKIIIITMGNKGVTTVSCNVNQNMDIRYYPVNVINSVENVSGAGDCFASGFIHGTLLGYHEPLCVSLGFEAAKCALFSKSTVPLEFQISPNLCESPFKKF